MMMIKTSHVEQILRKQRMQAIKKFLSSRLHFIPKLIQGIGCLALISLFVSIIQYVLQPMHSTQSSSSSLSLNIDGQVDIY